MPLRKHHHANAQESSTVTEPDISQPSANNGASGEHKVGVMQQAVIVNAMDHPPKVKGTDKNRMAQNMYITAAMNTDTRFLSNNK